MINPSFLDICISLLISDKVKSIEVSKTILEITNFYEKQNNGDIPLLFKDKFDLVKILADKRLSGLDIKCCIDDISSLSRFKDLIPYIENKSKNELKESDIVSFIDRIKDRKKLITVYQNKDEIKKFISLLEEENFDGVDSVLQNYETLVKKMFVDLVESSRTGSIESISQIDFDSDDYNNILEQISTCYDPQNSITTGYPELDLIMNGGFEPTRTYITAGASNSGKTNFLINFALNAALQPSDDLKCFLFITLENLVHENIVRIYCKLFRKTTIETIQDVRNGIDIVSRIEDRLKECNSRLIMKYYPSYTISPVDLMIDLDEVQHKYETSVKALYVDYLDLMRSDITNKDLMYRLELGFIALSLKALAIKYNLPVITVSQLNRGAYNSNPDETGVENIGESIKKVEHSDWVGLLTEDNSDQNIRHLKIGKNRSGPKGFRLTFDVDFSYYDVLRVRQSSVRTEDLRTIDSYIENPFQNNENNSSSRTVVVSNNNSSNDIASNLFEECFS